MATPVLARMKSITRYCQPGSVMYMRNQKSSNPPYVMVTVMEGPQDANTVLIKEADGTQTRAATADLFPDNLDQQPDCSLLFHISEATLLANLLKRDAISLPYTPPSNYDSASLVIGPTSRSIEHSSSRSGRSVLTLRAARGPVRRVGELPPPPPPQYSNHHRESSRRSYHR